MRYLLVLLSLSFIILVHELGHFIAARRVGIPIEIFSIGFGPTIWRTRRGQTEFRIAAIPLGGYVLPMVDDEAGLDRYTLRQRLLLAAGGPLASLIYPWICFIILGLASAGFAPNLLWDSLQSIFRIGLAMIHGIGMAITHPQALSGVVGIVAEGGRFAGSDLHRLLTLSAMLSINLAIFNLLPLPALDGGKILLYILEKVHPKLHKLQEPLTITGWVCIMILMLYVTVLDIGKYIVRPFFG